MAKYTTEIRSIVESGFPIFDFDYPIFDSMYKSVLEQKIIDHYYFREIGLETVGQFKHFLKTRLNEIMPYYNEHYERLKEFKTYDAYINKDLKTTELRTNNQEASGESDSVSKNIGTSSSKSDGEASNNQVYSDTPQAKLNGLDYATNTTENNDTSKGTSSTDSTVDGTDSSTMTNTVSTTDDYMQHIIGFDGMKYASEVYVGVRESIINIDLMIIKDLNDLFMNVH